nr:MAG TPA: putative protease [Caudoviricetes sp.]
MEENTPPSQTNSNWYEADGLDKSLITDKVRTFTNDDGSLNVGEMLKSYNSAQAMLGSSVRLPNEKSSPEEVEAFWGRMGVPKSAKEYDWKVPEGYQTLDEEFNAFKEECHALKLSKKQVGGILDAWLKRVNSIEAKQAKDFEAREAANFAALSAADAWGEKAREKIDAVHKRMGAYGDGRGLEKLKAAGLANDPDILRMLAEVMSDSDSSKIVAGGGEGQSKADEIAALKASPAYLNRTHKDHGAVVRRINELRDGE